MPVPTLVSDLSTTAASNSPAGTESPVDGDNYIRALSAFIAQQRDQLNGTTPTTAFTITTLTFTTANGATLNLSGNATITGNVSCAALTTTGNNILGNAQADTLNVGNGDIIKNASGQTGLGVSPTVKLQVESGATSEVARFQATANPLISLYVGATGRAFFEGSTTAARFGALGASLPAAVYVNGADRLTVTTAGLVDCLAGAGSLRFNGHISRFVSADQTISGGAQTWDVTHGGTRVPDIFMAVLKNTTTEHGWSPGREIMLASFDQNGSQFSNISADATKITLQVNTTPRVSSSATPPVTNAITTTSWRVVLKCIWL